MAEKKIVLCDTNIIIDLFKDKEIIIEKIRSIGEDSMLFFRRFKFLSLFCLLFLR